MSGLVEGRTGTDPATGRRVIVRNGRVGYMDASPIGGPSGAQRRLSSQDQSFLSEQRSAAQQAAEAERASQRFLELNRKQGTGEIYSLPGVSELRGAFDPNMSEMEALTNRMAPALRQPGSGAMSDKDLALFKKSIPNPNFPGPTNQRLAQGISQGAQRQRDYVAFLERYARQNGTIVGAQEQWDAMQRQPAQPRTPLPRRQPSGPKPMSQMSDAELRALIARGQ